MTALSSVMVLNFFCKCQLRSGLYWCFVSVGFYFFYHSEHEGFSCYVIYILYVQSICTDQNFALASEVSFINLSWRVNASHSEQEGFSCYVIYILYKAFTQTKCRFSVWRKLYRFKLESECLSSLAMDHLFVVYNLGNAILNNRWTNCKRLLLLIY